jgi:hypothetical protein
MNDKTELKSEANTTHGLSSTEGAVLQRLVMPDQLRMNAYYYGFKKTGVIEIDRILSAVAMAGKAYHGTNQWEDETYTEQLNYGGKITPVELIQEMANRAAKALSEKA